MEHRGRHVTRRSKNSRRLIQFLGLPLPLVDGVSCAWTASKVHHRVCSPPAMTGIFPARLDTAATTRHVLPMAGNNTFEAYLGDVNGLAEEEKRSSSWVVSTRRVSDERLIFRPPSHSLTWTPAVLLLGAVVGNGDGGTGGLP